MRHLGTVSVRLLANPSTLLGAGRVELAAPPGVAWTVDRVVLAGNGQAKAWLEVPIGVVIGGTRSAQADVIGDIGVDLPPGLPLALDVFDGVVGAVHRLDAYGT